MLTKTMHAFRVSAQPLKLRYVRGSYPAGAESILSTHEYANSVNAISLLRARRERPRRRCHTAEQRDELAAFQLIELHSVPVSQKPRGRISNWQESVTNKCRLGRSGSKTTFVGHHHWNSGVNLAEDFRLLLAIDPVCEVGQPTMEPLPEGEPVVNFGRHRHRAQASNVHMADLTFDAACLDQADP
jgi:hypothetical protein